MLGLASSQGATSSQPRAARRWPDPELPVGGPEGNSELAPQVQGAGQKMRPVPAPGYPSLCAGLGHSLLLRITPSLLPGPPQ